MTDKIYSVLNNVFGYSSFRPLQEEIINNILAGKDTLGVMPTGAGKSICFQIPAILSDGLTVVISPLISLMKDQVEQLREYEISAIFLNSSLSAQEYMFNLDQIKFGAAKLLYVAPETLMSDRVQDILKDIKLSLFAVDEAHCISEWGHDFRPEYRKLKFIREMFPRVPFAAFTATATPRVREDIVKNLDFKNYKIFVGSFDRPNLFLQILQKHQPLNQVLDFLDKYPGQPGIIYCSTRKQVDLLCSDLKKYGHSAEPYHAGMDDQIRMENQQKFLRDDIRIIVATIAFGMGINKSNVRFVIHYDLPKNIESYYQEIGRAGRDGLRAFCLMLFGYKDIDKIKYFISQKTEAFERELGIKHLNDLIDYAEYYHCRRVPMLDYFGEKYHPKNCGMCDNCNDREKNVFDLTVPAQKILSCIKRTGQAFPEDYVIDVLLGKNDHKINEMGHQELSTFGIGKEYTHRQWGVITQQLLKQDYLIREENRGPLLVSQTGSKILRGKELFFGFIPKEESRKVSIASPEYDNYDEVLFKELKALRKSIADSASVPPYVIFSDKTLIEMSSKKPKNKIEMLSVNGVGEVKFHRYGLSFLKTIEAFYRADAIKPLHETKKSSLSKTILTVGEELNNGASVLDLMSKTKLKKATIIKYILKYVEAGNVILPDSINELYDCREKIRNEALKLISLKDGNLELVYSEMIGKISYEDLSLVKIEFLLERR